MPEPANVAKAEIREISWDANQQANEINPDRTVTVQFNPESLKVNFSNQSAGGDQRGGSAVQFVGAGTTKLSLELWFDVTAPLADGSMQEDGDVRRLTEKVAYFITPVEVSGNGNEKKWRPPGVRFIWGSFKFDGIMDSLNESLEFFSEHGKPMRASVSISLSQQQIQFQFGEQNAPGLSSVNTPGTQPQQPVNEGDSVQDIAARAGRPQDWKNIAAANNIENPRQLAAGTLLNLNAGVGISGGIGGSIGGGISGGIGAGISGGIGAGISGGISGGIGVGVGGSADLELEFP